jgi:TRAP-type C4-dicarboxylate transport system permease small subunit
MKIVKLIEGILVKVEISFLVLFLTIMILLAFLQVVLRNVFSTGILWADTFLRYLVLWVGFLGAAVATHEERHINIDALTRFFSPYLKNLISIITNAVATVACYYMLKASIDFIRIGLPPDLTLFLNIPLLYFIVIVPIGFGLMALHFFLRVIIKINLAFNRSNFSGGQI